MSAETPPAATVALIGNPNTGKTTLFNALTGLSQHVGNYPGATVERKIGHLDLSPSGAVDLFDLPGTYSLAAHSPDEILAVDVLLSQRADAAPVDAILAIVDASNLHRNFYLISQLVELDRPLLIALNMTDVAQRRGVRIDAAGLAQRLGVPVVPISARQRQGLDELRQALAALIYGDAPARAQTRPTFPAALQGQVDALAGRQIPDADGSLRTLSPVEALRALVDEDGSVEQRLNERLGPEFAAELTTSRNAVGTSDPLSGLESEARYAWIDQVIGDCLQQPGHLQSHRSDRIDRVLTHSIGGTFIFIAINALVFQAIYTWAGPLMDIIDTLFGQVGAWAGAILPQGPLRSLVVDGIIGGVGGVLIFLPQIAILFLFIALLEDCGYMARAALLMDRLLTRCGLSGKSFIPLLSSFACAVPGIMSARTIEDRRDRFTTILVAPLMSCSARLPVYILFIGAFIPDQPLLGGFFNLQGLVLLGMYSIGILVAIPLAWLLKKTLLKGEAPPFLMELPSYKVPAPRTILLRVYHSGSAFVTRAGSIILATTIAMWALAYFPRSETVIEQYEQERVEAHTLHQDDALTTALAAINQRQAADLISASFLGQAGMWIEPAVRPLGWDWRIGMATLASFPAREVIISVLGTIYSLGGDQDEESSDLRAALHKSTWPDGRPVFNVPVVLSIMVFFALCAQCAATLATIQRETNSWLWPLFTFAYMTGLAYVGAFITYQLTMWLGWGG